MWKIVIFGFVIACVRCQGFYKVVGPRAVRPNSEYHVAVSIQQTSEPTTVRATLQGISPNGSIYTSDDRVEVQPYTSRILRLEVGDVDSGDYKLVVSGKGGVDFYSDYPVEFVEKSYSVFIQTDRAVYKPGSKVLFRAVVLNSQLKPAAEVRNELLHIFVTDGQGNRIKEWKGIQALRGVFTGEVKLSESPVLGNWNISVKIHGQTFSKSIEVAEYILPKFIVNIQAPKHMTFKENVLVANIQTQYNYGKKVKGEATVTVYPTIFSGVIQPIFQNPIRKVIPIEGSATVTFDIAKELKLTDEYERVVMVDVTVEEASTGRRQNNSVEVHLHKYNYKMDLIKTADYFKPGLKYTAYVKVSSHEGTPLRSENREVTVRYGYSRADEVYVTEKHRLDKNGVAKLEYYTPVNVTNTTALRIEAQYQDLKERISPIPAAVSYSNTFLQVSLETERPIVNLDVEILVNCTERLRYISYVLMGRGDVLNANTFQVDNMHEYRFHFTATHAMVPVAHLIVSYVRDDGELVGDALDIEVDGLLQNYMEIQVNPVETEPELDIDIAIRAQPNSYVAIMAVDQNAVKMRPGFDLTHSEVAEELKKYDPAQQSPYSMIMHDSKYHFFWKPGAANPHSAIYNSGADLLTNSHVDRHQPTLEDIYLRPVFYGTSTVKPDRGFGLPLHTVTRPPLAGPYAFSRIPKPVWNKPKVYLTEEIADTWLFTNFSSGYEGKTSIRRKIPSSLNTWVVTGFSLDPIHGLGLTTTSKKVKVSKSFVVTLDLPFSVQRREILAVPVVVYNYMDKDVNAEVTLHNPEQKFEFAEVSNNVNSTRKVELYRRKKINIKRNSGTSVSFMIRPLKQDTIEIKVTANSPKNQDVAIKHLQVTTEGETEYYTKTVLIDLRNNPNYKKSINFTIPQNMVTGSEKIEVSAVGDLLGPTMVHLENLIRLPTGCGEQNLIHLMPNLIILQYLRYTRQVTPTIQNEALDLLEKGYQQQLSYKRKDGSFSAFGMRDEKSSVWVTAYVALTLRQAKGHIYVDEKIIEGCLEWLANIQGRNGSFVEVGSVIYKEIQSREGNSLALTAFTLLAFIENQKYASTYSNTINKGLDYIARYISEQESIHTIALCSYTLQLARHPSKQSAFNLLDLRSKSRGNLKWWSKDVPSNEIKNPWNKLPRSIDIETSAYGLLTFLEANYFEDAIPVLNWLLDQQNSLGGFTSSQDTFVGLWAIYKLVLKLATNVNMQVEFTYGKDQRHNFNVNKNNAMIVQKLQLPKDIREVNVTAQGKGLAVFRVSYEYNMNVTGPWPMFTLDPQVDKNSNKDHLQVSICTGFVSRNLSETPESNMAVMEVNLPSGFTADIDSLPSLEVSQNVQKVETSNGLTRVTLYFNNVSSVNEYCPTVSAFRTHKVANQKPVSVIIFDYYDSSRRARQFYRSRTSTLCDICEDEDCGDICTSKANPQVGEDSQEGKGSSAALRSSWLGFLVVMFAIVQL
ncbi:CD109 antigen-like Protein [Tribolium castaneum]|uniref:TEP1-F n=1 Tax=Tribolium castaneum TaxID=7070 RepID=D6WNG7_TRICA|nr:PREDICTED: CD109 antigen [Tribolium castaneum]EFA04694.1 CD109 antigen-like Protein [Tribolium castaneum]|eukprot:XP_015835945.1 PREDICTED: CD109 antigen [Tribolium castaneum]